MLAGLKRNSFLMWAVSPAIFTVLILWYQFGFSLGAMLEEWWVIALIQKHPSFWSTFPGQLLSDKFAARPLQILPHYIANLISSDSFVGFHVVLMAGCVLRVIGAASLGNFLFRNKAYAAAFGMLCFVFPADTQQFEFRTVHIVFAIGMIVFGSACTVRAFYAVTSSKRWSALISSMVFSCVAVLIYEPVITLYMLGPLSILARNGFRNSVDFLRRRKLIAIAWLAGPLINVAYLFYAIVIFQSSYQVNAANGSMTYAIAHNLHYLIDSAAYRVFYDAWVSTWWILTEHVVHYRFITFTGVVLLVGLLLLSERSQSDVPLVRTIRFLFAGLILSVAGYLPFMVAESHMVITQRTFMTVAPGASLLVIAVIAWLCQRRTAVGTIIAAGFIFLGFVQQLYQFDRYTRDYTGIVLPYTAMLQDKTDPAKRVHLVIDRTGFGGHLNGMYESKVENAASIRRREDDGTSILCMDEPQTTLLPYASCTFKNGEWVVRGFDGVVTAYPERDVQVIAIGPDFDPSYRSRRSSWHDPGSFVESKSLFATRDPHAYHCEADSMWGYSDFCRGLGWSDGIFNHDHFEHVNYFVATSQNASLIFSLLPIAKPYLLRAVIFGGFGPDFLSHIKVTVNGADAHIKVINGQMLQAEVPASLLRVGQNQIDFLNVALPGSTARIALSRVDLAPVGSPQLPMIPAEKHLPTIGLDQWQAFDSDNIRPMLGYGFSATESKGTWTDGKSAQMAFKLPKGTSAGTFVGEAIPFFTELHTRVDVSIDVNGQHVSDKSFIAPAKVESFAVPFEISSDDANRAVIVTFTFKKTAKPGAQDQRELGLYFMRFKVSK